MRTMSRRNPWYLSNRRRRYVRSFCEQYGFYKAEYESLEDTSKAITLSDMPKGTSLGDPTQNAAFRRAELSEKVNLIENLVHEVAPEIEKWLLFGVTQGVSYKWMHDIHHIPCGKNYYYDKEHEFFYKLSMKI